MLNFRYIYMYLRYRWQCFSTYTSVLRGFFGYYAKVFKCPWFFAKLEDCRGILKLTLTCHEPWNVESSHNLTHKIDLLHNLNHIFLLFYFLKTISYIISGSRNLIKLSNHFLRTILIAETILLRTPFILEVFVLKCTLVCSIKWQ